jgi:hypothetical protein
MYFYTERFLDEKVLTLDSVKVKLLDEILLYNFQTAKPWFTLYISRKNIFFYDFFLTCCLLSRFNILNQIPANIPAYFAEYEPTILFKTCVSSR